MGRNADFTARPTVLSPAQALLGKYVRLGWIEQLGNINAQSGAIR